MAMSELMEDTKKYLPENLYLNMYNQLKKCKDISDTNRRIRRRTNQVSRVSGISRLILSGDDEPRMFESYEPGDVCSTIMPTSPILINNKCSLPGARFLFGRQNISSKLRTFLNLQHDVKISQTDVINKIISYINNHNLQLGGSSIDLLKDTMESNKLHELLEPHGDSVTIYTLPRYLDKHFI